MSTSSMVRIARWSRTLRIVVWLALALLVAVHLALWLTGAPELLAAGFGGTVEIRIESQAERLLGLVATLPATLLMAYALFRLARMLACFEAGEIFTVRSIGHLRAFGLATLLSGLASLIESPVLGALLARETAAADHRLQVVIRSDDLWTVLIGGLMFLIGQIMVEAQRIAADSAEII